MQGTQSWHLGFGRYLELAPRVGNYGRHLRKAIMVGTQDWHLGQALRIGTKETILGKAYRVGTQDRYIGLGTKGPNICQAPREGTQGRHQGNKPMVPTDNLLDRKDLPGQSPKLICPEQQCQRKNTISQSVLPLLSSLMIVSKLTASLSVECFHLRKVRRVGTQGWLLWQSPTEGNYGNL